MTDKLTEPLAADADSDPSAHDVEELRVQLTHAREGLVKSERMGQASVERERLLRNELQHRVRNTLALVRSVFSRTVNAGGSLSEVADHFHGRLDVLSRYENVATSGLESDLHSMIWDELRAFEFDERIQVEGPELAIPQDLGFPLGLAIHELTTNSIKFGALSGSAEEVRLHITWEQVRGVVTLYWKEAGVAILAAAPMRRGFGREFLEEALPYQLGATTRFELRPGGVFCSITVPFA
jgi:two-component sensor histidine kinase